MSGTNGELPPGWEMATLEDLGTWLGGGTPSKKVADYWGGDIPWVTPKDMKTPKLDGSQDRITAKAVAESATKLVPAGSLAFVVRSGILEHTLPIALIGCDATVNQDLKVLTPHADLNPEWLLYALLALAPMIRRECRKDGTTVASLDFPKLRRYPVPLPPRAEQDRIVEAVESAMAATRRGMEELSEATQLTAALRDGVLEHALPSGTSEVELQECLLEPPRNGRSVPTASSGFPVLRLTAIRDGRVDTREAKTGAWSEEEARPFLIREGDFLVVRGNGSLRLVGRGGLVGTAPERVAYPDTLIRLRPNPEKLSGEYLRAVWNSRRIRRQLESQARTTAGIYKINQQMLKALRIPLPPLDVQQVVARAVKNRLTDFDSQTRELEKQSRAARHLEFQLLHQAFTGQLVPQDPDDEPASELLKRIEAEKAEREAESKAARRRRRKVGRAPVPNRRRAPAGRRTNAGR